MSKTFGEVVQARINRSIDESVRANAEIAKRQRIEGILAANAEIGVLMRNGGAVYYVNFPVYREAKDPAALLAAKAEG